MTNTPIREAIEEQIEQYAPALAHLLQEPCDCPKGGYVSEDPMQICPRCKGSEWVYKFGALEAIETLLSKHTERAVLKAKAEEHELVYDKSVQLSFEAFCTWSDDRIKTLKTQLEAKE